MRSRGWHPGLFLKITLFVSGLFLVFIFTAKHWHSSNHPNIVSSNHEEYIVYSAYLRDKLAEDSPRRLLVIRSATTLPEDPTLDFRKSLNWTSAAFRRQLANIESETVSDMYARNTTSETLTRKFDSDLDYQLLTESQSPSIFYRSEAYTGWRRFYTQFPNSSGIYHFSSPGFNRDQTQALFFVGHAYGSLGGQWGYAVMEKKDGKWKLIIDLMLMGS